MLVAGAGANCEMIPRGSPGAATPVKAAPVRDHPIKGGVCGNTIIMTPPHPVREGGKVPTLGYFRSLFYYSALYKIFSGGVPPVISASRMDGIHTGGPPMSTWRSAHVP